MGYRLAFYGVLLILGALWVLPVAMMVSTSVAAPEVFFDPKAIPFFSSVTLEHWVYVLQATNIMEPLSRSVVAALGTTLLTLLLTLPAAFAISNLSQRAIYLCLVLIFSLRMLPEVSVALPISVTFAQIGVFDTVIGVVLAHTVRAFPLAAWILINTMKNIPPELHRAAKIDGCGYFQSFSKVTLPIARPGIIVAAIFTFLASWEEFTYASYLTIQNKTLPIEVFYHVNRSGWFIASTYSVVITIPVLVVTYFFQRYLTADYFSGAVKG